MAVLLDTCTWVWHCARPEKLSEPAREAIEKHRKEGPGSGLIVSVISTWEVAKLVEKKKLAFSIPCRQWIEAAVRQEGIELHALTPEIALESTELPGLFHGDPADQIIVATARARSVAIVTPDRRIREYPHVATLW
jgi:PIN domain nuclease of toxin-antitoxin system